jgi:hypothetical protein
LYAAPVRLTRFRAERLGHLLRVIVDEAGCVTAVADVRRDVGIDLDPVVPVLMGSRRQEAVRA